MLRVDHDLEARRSQAAALWRESDDLYCGAVTGELLIPSLGSIDGSSFAAVRLDQAPPELRAHGGYKSLTSVRARRRAPAAGRSRRVASAGWGGVERRT